MLMSMQNHIKGIFLNKLYKIICIPNGGRIISKLIKYMVMQYEDFFCVFSLGHVYVKNISINQSILMV
ncbi:hypothetical protein A6A30_22950 [Klebsiella michiganensis]|nr:hypothetical protein A6A30_22950 [Klebsiella michiganensis]